MLHRAAVLQAPGKFGSKYCLWWLFPGTKGLPRLGPCTGGGSALLMLCLVCREAKAGAGSPPRLTSCPGQVVSPHGQGGCLPWLRSCMGQAGSQLGCCWAVPPTNQPAVARACRAPGQPRFPPSPHLPRGRLACGTSPCTCFSPHRLDPALSTLLRCSACQCCSCQSGMWVCLPEPSLLALGLGFPFSRTIREA